VVDYIHNTRRLNIHRTHPLDRVIKLVHDRSSLAKTVRFRLETT